jgi:E-phenylitaconyl-CoA hydratase
MSVQYQRDGAVATIAIAGLGERHWITPDTAGQVNSRLMEFDAAPAATVCILRGAGGDHFSAGAREPGPVSDGVFRPSKPVIAAIAGDCFGEGLVLVAQASDVRIAGEHARFGFPGRDGLGTLLARSRLRHQIPYAPLMAMILTGETIDAREAQRIGLVTLVVPDAEVFEQAHAVARRIDALPPFTTRLEKTAILACEHLNAADAVYFGWAFDCMTHRHPDGLEGVSSWVEKREPRFWRFDAEG